LAGDPTLSLRREEIRQRGIRAAAAVALLVVALRFIPLTSDLLPFTLIEHLAYDIAHDRSKPAAPPDILIVAIDDTYS
jgi:CHASE2 domain-containing sensor protein